MSNNPLLKLHEFGQSVWLDFTERRMTQSGQMQRLIEEDGLRGVTSNPTIFEKAFGSSQDYDDEIRRLGREGKNAAQIFETIAVEDLQAAADLFRPGYNRDQGRDGFVSMEVSPHLAHDTEGTCAEARRFWTELARPNVMIKVPATNEGLPAIRALTAEGINVNITLLFGLPRYRNVVDAYMSGLEERLAHGQPIDHIASVASFFLSRIDVLLDPQFEKVASGGGPSARTAGELHGQVAIASAKVAYEIYRELFAGERWQRLAAAGARAQRLLWASTGTKNPAYSDVKYVEPLIGPDTINTMPLETLEAYRDHGHPDVTLTNDVTAAHATLDRLADLGIDLDQATHQLAVEGEQKFNASYDKLMQALEKKRAAVTA